jgi:uncharacterized protein (TIRG00374 family)
MKRKRLTFQQVIYALLAAAFAYAVFSYRDQLTDTAAVLQGGVWYLVLITLGVLAVAIYNQASLYASLYQIFELPQQRKHLLPLYLVTRFVMVAAPSGGLSGWVPFIQDARKRDLGVGTVLIANLVYMILWYSAFALFLFVGLLHLFLAHDLQWFEISAAIVLLAVDAVMISILFMSAFSPRLLRVTLDWVRHTLEKVWGWLNRPAPLKAHQVDRFIEDLEDAIAQMRRVGWRGMLRPIGHALLNETLNLAMLYILARSFGLHLLFGVLVAAYSVSILFYIISPTPGGIGFVEGALVLILTSLGVARARATVLTIAYRGITFWLPFILGFVALRWASRMPLSDPENNGSGGPPNLQPMDDVGP